MSNAKVTIDVGVNAHADGLEDIKRQAGEVDSAQKRMAESGGEAAKVMDEAFKHAADTLREVKNMLPDIIKGFQDIAAVQGAAGTGLGDVVKEIKALQAGQNHTILPEILKQLQDLKNHPGPAGSPSRTNPLKDNSPDGLLQRVQGNLITTDAYLNAASRPSDFVSIQRRLGIAQSLLGQAAQGGADQQRVQELTNRINELTKALQDAKEAYRNTNPNPGPGPAGGGGPGAPGGPPPADAGSEGGGAANMALQALSMFRTGGLMGSVLGRLGIPGLVIGGTMGAVNYLDRSITRSNDVARRTVQADADLARQYGYEKEPLTLFRGKDLLTLPELAKLGYTAADAGQVAATYNLPGGMRGDVTNLLKFSRVTGMDEGVTAQAGRTLSLTGALGRGDNLKGLETLKMAISEGIKVGVAGSDTIRQLVNYAEANYKNGITSNQQSLQYMAGLQQALAGTGNRALQGEAGAKAMDSLMGGITGKDNYAQQAYLFQSTGGFSAKELGLTGDEAKGYESLQKSSPFMAFQQALNLIRAGRGSGASKTKLAQAMYDASGGNAAILSGMLSDWGLEGDQQLQFLGQKGSFVGTFKEAQKQTGNFSKAGPMEDPQGRNYLDYSTRYKDASVKETEWLNSATSLKLTGTLENQLAKFRSDLAKLAAGVLDTNSILQEGKLNGNPGGNSQQWMVKSTAQVPQDRTLWALGMVESTGGRNPNMDKGSARGVYQLQAQNLIGWDPKNPNPAGDYDKKYLGYEIKGADGKPLTNLQEARQWITDHPEEAEKIARGFINDYTKQVRAKYEKQGTKFGSEAERDIMVAAAVGALWHNGGNWNGMMKDGKLLLPKQFSQKPHADGISDYHYGLKIFNALVGQATQFDAQPASRTVPQPGKETPDHDLSQLNPTALKSSTNITTALTTLGATKINLEVGTPYSQQIRKQYPGLPATHQGVDFRIGNKSTKDPIKNPFIGAQVLRALPGTKDNNQNDGYGNMLELKLKNGMVARLAHLDAIKVKAGQVLKEGDLLGIEGNSGAADGIHLHMELLKEGKAITDETAWWSAFLEATTNLKAPKPAPPKTTPKKNTQKPVYGPPQKQTTPKKTTPLLPPVIPKPSEVFTPKPASPKTTPKPSKTPQPKPSKTPPVTPTVKPTGAPIPGGTPLLTPLLPKPGDLLLPPGLSGTQSNRPQEQRILVQVIGLDEIHVKGMEDTSRSTAIKRGVSTILQAVLPQPTGHIGS
ncbi:peptidoglycan DD-metalloendopeptidase family protein [Deinococcus cellulosilyticus]|uniref:M23ase beta-sheet core domain-containing protein n=1 Tax=Deinococcus cellulosilyticus (strain DSM 18568 / NBRC 106333 / KACC 11606 / 5516J-15) TaxID=1223518 RepID=A0A511N874_DEIC1|nr:peptidoglycan DD-metalloendopeptidase family protein [Deinococcus cellulosilyticus]GEM48688.1 hypothetical protein DC3_43230 [Deinococcus cellulosilyticus NBRC 106333 = KACC 11606]